MPYDQKPTGSQLSLWHILNYKDNDKKWTEKLSRSPESVKTVQWMGWGEIYGGNAESREQWKTVGKNIL